MLSEVVGLGIVAGVLAAGLWARIAVGRAIRKDPVLDPIREPDLPVIPGFEHYVEPPVPADVAAADNALCAEWEPQFDRGRLGSLYVATKAWMSGRHKR